MDRQIVYIGQIPQDTDLLQQNKNTMVGLGYALQAILGTSTLFDGLACTPNSPAALNVLVGPGSVYSIQNVDGTAYGSLAPDTTNQIVKQGIVQTTTTLNTPAPGTAGQSINYLIQAAYQDVDSGSTVLPYYNASNPSVAWSGPNNTGVSQNTVRKGVCTVSVKAGTAATTGTQTTPAPDAGYTGLYVVTVANGQSTVTSGNITQLSTAPFIGTKLPDVLAAIQKDTPNYAADTSGAANTITASLSPAPAALTNGMVLRVKVANTSTGATVINTNGLGNVAAVTQDGSAFVNGTVVANGVYTFVYDANGTRWQLQGGSAASISVPPTFRNAVVNGDMAVAQRGTSFSSIAASVVQTLDSWFAYAAAGASESVSQQSGVASNGFNNSIRMQRPNGNTSTANHRLAQIIESADCYRFAGQTVTLSYYCKVGANFSAPNVTTSVVTGTGVDEGNAGISGASWTGIATPLNTNISPTTSWQRFTHTFTIGSTVSEICIKWYRSGNQSHS